jgi:hypothetical protein
MIQDVCITSHPAIALCTSEETTYFGKKIHFYAKPIHHYHPSTIEIYTQERRRERDYIQKSQSQPTTMKKNAGDRRESAVRCYIIKSGERGLNGKESQDRTFRRIW